MSGQANPETVRYVFTRKNIELEIENLKLRQEIIKMKKYINEIRKDVCLLNKYDKEKISCIIGGLSEVIELSEENITHKNIIE
jgi:hypothetical protein